MESVLRLLLKDLGLENLHETARRVKPDSFTTRCARSRLIGRSWLGTASARRISMGRWSGRTQDRYWLFLEKIPGVRLCQVRDLLRLAAGGPLAGALAFPVLGEKARP